MRQGFKHDMKTNIRTRDNNHALLKYATLVIKNTILPNRLLVIMKNKIKNK